MSHNNLKVLLALCLANLMLNQGGGTLAEAAIKSLPDELSDMREINFYKNMAHPVDRLDALLAERKVDLENTANVKELIAKVESFVTELYGKDSSFEPEYNALQFLRYLARLSDSRGPKCSAWLLQGLQWSIDELRERPNMGKMASLARQIGLKIMEQKCKPYLETTFQKAYKSFTTEPNTIERKINSELMAEFGDSSLSYGVDEDSWRRLFHNLVEKDVVFGVFVPVFSYTFGDHPEDHRLDKFEDVFEKHIEQYLNDCSQIESGLGLVVRSANVIKTLANEDYNRDLNVPNYFNDNVKLFEDTQYRLTICADIKTLAKSDRIKRAILFSLAETDAWIKYKQDRKKAYEKKKG